MIILQGARLILYNRNVEAHGQAALSPSSVVHSLKLQCSRGSYPQTSRISIFDRCMSLEWFPPMHGFLKVNVELLMMLGIKKLKQHALVSFAEMKKV